MNQVMRCGYFLGTAQGFAMAKMDGSNHLVTASEALNSVPEPALDGAKQMLSEMKVHWAQGAPKIEKLVNQIQAPGGKIHNSVSAGYLLGVAFAASKYGDRDVRPAQIVAWIEEAGLNAVGLSQLKASSWDQPTTESEFRKVAEPLKKASISLGELRNHAQKVENLYTMLYNRTNL